MVRRLLQMLAFLLVGPPVGAWVFVFWNMTAAAFLMRGDLASLDSQLGLEAAFGVWAVILVLIFAVPVAGYVLGCVPALMTGAICAFLPRSRLTDRQWRWACIAAGAVVSALFSVWGGGPLIVTQMAVVGAAGAWASCSVILWWERRRRRA